MHRSTLDWSERSRSPHREMLEWYRSLIALRHRLPELTDGRRDQVHVSVDEDDGLIIVKRGRVTLVGTIGTKTLRFSSDGRLELSFPALQQRGNETFLPPDSCAVWVNRD
jgi:maltooligosyltrehalose trehalohydrolase